LFSSVVIAAVQ